MQFILIASVGSGFLRDNYGFLLRIKCHHLSLGVPSLKVFFEKSAAYNRNVFLLKPMPMAVRLHA